MITPKKIISYFKELRYNIDDIKNLLECHLNPYKLDINNKKQLNLYNDFYEKIISDLSTSDGIGKIYLERITPDSLYYEIQKIMCKYNKDIYILSDINLVDMPITQISIDDIKTLPLDSKVILAYQFDFNSWNAINELRKHKIKYIGLTQVLPLARYFHINKIALETLVDEYNSNYVEHYCPLDFENIFQAIEATKNLDGDIIEIGTFQGSSARAILNYISRSSIEKTCYFFDTFEGFTYKEAYSSEDTIWIDSHTNTSIETVNNYLSLYKNFELIKSNIISDEIPEKIKKICLANIDVDMYDAVKSSLYKIKDKIIKNGIIIVEDYGHTPHLVGAQKAVNEFIEENNNMFIPIYMFSGQMFLMFLIKK